MCKWTAARMNRNKRSRGGSLAGTGPAAAGGGCGVWGGAALCLVGLLLLLGDHLADSLPIVDPGLFVILGVRTCGGGGGYCLLGTDCTLDRDFAADVEGGHCDGLRAAFTPAAHFSCCKYVERSNVTLPGEPADTTTTEDPALPAATTLQPSDDAENVIETEVRVKPADGQDAVKEADKDAVKEVEKGAGEEPVKAAEPEREDDYGPVKITEQDAVVSAPPHTAPVTEALRVPLGPASGQTVVAVSEEYKVQGAPAEDDVEEDAEVVAVADVEKEAVLVSPSCRSPSADVNPCWRSSFQDRQGATLCSGTLVGVDAAVTTAVCANRLLESGMGAVALRVDGVSMPVRDVAVHPDYRAAADDANDIAVVRLFLPAGPPPGDLPVGLSGGLPGGLPMAVASAPAAAPSPSCIACLPATDDQGSPAVLRAGKTCYALAARLNGLGVETSAVCAGRIASAPAVHVKLSGCEVANLKTSIAAGEQVLAVRAREGAAMVCDGTLHGLASTPSGSYASLGQHARWLSKTLAAPRTSTFRS